MGPDLLTDDEKDEVRRLLDAGEPLPDKYRWKLFAHPRETELIWPGKTSEVANVVLPFQTIEQIDEPRAEASGVVGDLFQMAPGGRQSGGWANKLIWGDNKLVLASLKNGPLRREIEAAGGLKLVYIDPPFDVGSDFSITLEIGDEEVVKEPSIIEDIAYRDTWGRGQDSYIGMLFERINLVSSLLRHDGSIAIHCDWRVSALIRLALDEVFGQENLINEIVWVHQIMGGAHGARLPKAHETILWYSSSNQFRINASA